MSEDILKLQDQSGCFVAYVRAVQNRLPEWARQSEFTTLQCIIKCFYLTPEILLLPLDKNTYVYEYIFIKKFRRIKDS